MFNFSGTLTKTPKRKGYKKKMRDTYTYQKKLNKIKSFYNRVYNNSKKEKEKDKRVPPNHVFFCDKYPNFESFLQHYKLKEPTSKEINE